MKNYYTKFIFLILAFFLMSPPFSYGAELKFDKELEDVAVNQLFSISVVLDTEEELINALESDIDYSDNLKLETVSDGNSVINLWIIKPYIDNSGRVSLSGLIPGGIKTKSGMVLTLTFRALAEGSANIFFENTTAYLNNSEAAESDLKAKVLSVKINGEKPGPQINQKLILDFIPPDKFEIYLSRDKNIFGNSWFIAFKASDKGSGISHYEIRERFLGLFGRWIKGDSPYQLSQQSLFDIIEVKAVDNLGRERIEQLTPTRLYFLWLVLAAVPVVLIIGGFRKFLNKSPRIWKTDV